MTPGWCHQPILFVFCSMKLLQNAVKVYVSLSFFFFSLTMSMFPAGRKWGPRTGKMTNHFPDFCFETQLSCTVPLSVQFLFSNLCVRSALSLTCWLYSSSSSLGILSHSVFLQLIDSFALEIGELKEEMVQASPTIDKELMDPQGWDCFFQHFSTFLLRSFSLSSSNSCLFIPRWHK